MTTFSRTWDSMYESLPPDTGEEARLGASRIRQVKIDVRERLAVDHSMAGNPNDGKHIKITLPPRSTDPSPDPGDGVIYTKVHDGSTELFYRSSSGQVSRLTPPPEPPQVEPGFIVGEIRAISFPTVPDGWLECNGAAVSRTTYAQLFAVIGTIWGAGDGSTTFNLPDLRGRSLIGAGQGPGLTNRVLGQSLGEEAHLLTASESGLPGHSHAVTDPGHYHTVSAITNGNPEGGFISGTEGSVASSNVVTSTSATGITIQQAGPSNAAQAHNNMQPSAVIKWIIKY